MRAKATEKRTAIELRQTGYSLSEISAQLGIAKATASLWVGHLPVSKEARERIATRRNEARQRAAITNRKRVDEKFVLARTYGAEVLRKAAVNADTGRLICALLYWCEGTKIRRGEIMGFTNSDPELIAAFLKLLREGFLVDEKKLRLTVHLHEYHDEATQLRFWSKLTNIPLVQCHKPYRKLHTAKRTREGYQGCVSVRYLDVDFGRRLEGIAKTFLEKKGL